MASDKPTHYARKVRHFCSQSCYSSFREHKLPKEEQHAYGTGNGPEERRKRLKARSALNHAVRDGKLTRLPCEICGDKAEAHHADYTKPLAVRWLCFSHHRQAHENPELLTK